jgi:hypothetical protein
VTTMRLERNADGDILFSGEVSASDFANLKLDHFDRALLDDCGSKDGSAADWLLALEMLFRRISEQRADAIRKDTP